MTPRCSLPRRPRHRFLAVLVPALFVASIVPSLTQAVEELYCYHILVRSKGQADKALDEIINNGGTRKSFIDAARKYSMDHPTKGAGGDLGWNSRRKFVPEFAEAAFNLDVDQVSEPVRSQYGWHLIYVKATRDLARDKKAAAAKTGAPGATPPTPPTGQKKDPHEGHNHPPGQHGHDHGHDHGKPAITPKPIQVNPEAVANPTPQNPTNATNTTETPKTAVTETPKISRPAPKPVTAKPVKRNLPEQQLRLKIEAQRRDVSPTLTIDLSFVLENSGSQTQKVFNPDLLPLGLSVRTDTTPAAPPGKWEGLAEPSSFLVDLKSRAIVGGSVTLSDYFPDLPANCRLFAKWSPETFTENFNKRFPGKAQTIDGWALAVKAFPASNASQLRIEMGGLLKHNSWVYNREKELPLSIYEPITTTGVYFAKMTISRESTPLWFVLENEKQIQAVRHFKTLAAQGFYDGLRLYDIQKGEYVQGGCPKSDGTGGPERGRALSNSGKLSHEKGTLSFITRLRPRSRGREAGSIFFIARKDLSHFDDTHVPFGRLILGDDVLEKIENRASKWVNIESVSIVTEARAPAAVIEANGGTAPAVAVSDPGTTTTGATPDTTAASGSGVKTIQPPALPKVEIQTSKGNLTVELYQDDARNTVASFVKLIEDGFFTPKDGKSLQFFDKADGYYVRTGSPDNSETGGADYYINSENTNNTRRHEKGTLSMCLETNTATGKPIPNTASSQFFICLDDVPFWNGLYTPFGKVTSGLDVLAKIQKGDSISVIKVLEKRSGGQAPNTRPKK